MKHFSLRVASADLVW